jgi:hypothetical protein
MKYRVDSIESTYDYVSYLNVTNTTLVRSLAVLNEIPFVKLVASINHFVINRNLDGIYSPRLEGSTFL